MYSLYPSLFFCVYALSLLIISQYYSIPSFYFQKVSQRRRDCRRVFPLVPLPPGLTSHTALRWTVLLVSQTVKNTVLAVLFTTVIMVGSVDG